MRRFIARTTAGLVVAGAVFSMTASPASALQAVVRIRDITETQATVLEPNRDGSTTLLLVETSTAGTSGGTRPIVLGPPPAPPPTPGPF